MCAAGGGKKGGATTAAAAVAAAANVVAAPTATRKRTQLSSWLELHRLTWWHHPPAHEAAHEAAQEKFVGHCDRSVGPCRRAVESWLVAPATAVIAPRESAGRENLSQQAFRAARSLRLTGLALAHIPSPLFTAVARCFLITLHDACVGGQAEDEPGAG